MNINLRILLLEDSLADAKLIERELLRDGFAFSLSRVQTEAELRSELALAQPDLVLANHVLPKLDGFVALAIVRQFSAAVPFIFVSASNDQQLICDMFEEGASDYVFKRDLGDLGVAVTKATGVQPNFFPSYPFRPRVIWHFVHAVIRPVTSRARLYSWRIIVFTAPKASLPASCARSAPAWLQPRQ
jgi:PleD family two-component response regulator